MNNFCFCVASVLILITGLQCCRSHYMEGNVTFHDVSNDAVRSVIDDVFGDVYRSSNGSSDYCSEILAAYALAASDYIRCIVLHARELTKCRLCSEYYVAADDMYRNITEAQKSKSGSVCFEGNSHKVELVALSEVNDFVQASWKASLCSYCFVDPFSNGSHSSQLNNRTLHFFHLLSVFHECVLNHTQGDFDPFIDRLNSTGNLSVICHECHSSYAPLNNFFLKLEDEEIPICSDMENMMNLTHSLWNDLCHKVVHDVTSMVIVGVMATLPFFFYIATAINGKNPTYLTLRQKRWEHVMLVSEPGTRTIDSDSQQYDQYHEQ